MKSLKKPLVYVVLALVPMLFSKCTLSDDFAKLKSSSDSVRIFISTPVFKTKAHVEFVDAKTREIISGSNISLSLSGTDAASIYNNIGQKFDKYTSTFGMIDLVVDPHKVDTSAMKINPLRFDVSTGASGYVSTVKSIEISSANTNNVVVPLIKLSNLPEGINVVTNTNMTSSTSNGTVGQTATESLNAGKQNVQIPAGVILKDTNGNPVTGTINSQVIFYDPLSQSS